MFSLYQNVYDEIRDALEAHIPECGGVLGASPSQPISKFYFDLSGKSTADSYTPDYLTINDILDQWAEENVSMVGIVHSHADGGDFPSCGDLMYCECIMKAANYDQFYLPIVTLSPFNITPYMVEITDGKLRVKKESIIIV